MPEAFDHFFALFGACTSDYLDLVELTPGYRVFLAHMTLSMSPLGVKKQLRYSNPSNPARVQN